MKSVQTRSFFWSVYSRTRVEYEDLLRKSLYSVRARKNTDQKKLRMRSLFTQFWWRCWAFLDRKFCFTYFNFYQWWLLRSRAVIALKLSCGSENLTYTFSMSFSSSSIRQSFTTWPSVKRFWLCTPVVYYNVTLAPIFGVKKLSQVSYICLFLILWGLNLSKWISTVIWNFFH